MGQGIVGGFVTLGIGVIVIAAIYQLNSRPGVVNATQSVANNTLTSLFK